jgi:VCBS repeat-containing protein
MFNHLRQKLNFNPARRVSLREKGQSLVEMAIIAPLLIFLLLGTFEVGNAVRSYMVLVNVSREITRFAVRPGYMDFSTTDTIEASYQKVKDWVYTTLGDQLSLNFSEINGNATLIVSHMVVDTGLPCQDILTNPGGCDCNQFVTNLNYAKNYKLDDIIVHPDKPGMEYQAMRFGPAQTSTGSKASKIDFENLVNTEIAPENNRFNCELIKKGGVSSANNMIVTELFVDQPQLFGFPFISNPYTDPVPLYAHTSMRLVSAARSLVDNIDTVGPVCMAYPFTFNQSIFSDPNHPTAPQQIDTFEGDAAGNFGWITWNPDSSNNNANYIEDEMRVPQMSMNDFTNALNSSDHSLSVGDAVSTKPGIANSSGVDAQLQLLVGKTIIVPVYSNNPGTGENSYYVVSHFAQIQIDQICLPRNGDKCSGTNNAEIRATFLGYVDDNCQGDGGGGGGGGGGGVNNAPVAANDAASTVKNTSVIISVLTNDSDPDGDTLTIADATDPAKGTIQVSADGKTITYMPKNNDTGTYSFTYTISDGNGGTATATVMVTVAAGANNPPVAANDSATTKASTAVTVNVLNNDTDPDGDALTVSAIGAPAHGSVSNNGTSITYTPTAGYTGSDTFTYTVGDGKGGTATATVLVTVTAVNGPPAVANDSYTANEDTPLNVPARGVLSNDTDPNGDSLAAIKVSDPSNGTLTLNVDGSFTYTPNANFSGTDTFTYKASDGANSSTTNATVTIVVNPVNDPPVAGNDSYSVRLCRTLTVASPGVLANDTDIDTVVISAVKVSNPTKGSLTFNGVGSFTYTPTATGLDSFTYKANDSQADSNVATVSITVNANTTPTANNGTASIKKNGTRTISVSSLVGDADGDTLTLSGVVKTSGSGSVASYSGTTINYTAPSSAGSAVIQYTISDGCSTKSATINVTITNY